LSNLLLSSLKIDIGVPEVKGLKSSNCPRPKNRYQKPEARGRSSENNNPAPRSNNANLPMIDVGSGRWEVGSENKCLKPRLE
jgi:hypothetical protein